MKKTVILNFANHIGQYGLMQKRLADSLKAVGYAGDLRLYNHEEQIRINTEIVSPYHKSDDLSLHAAGRVVPYGFKAYAIKKAQLDGYETIIWMDSAIYATKSIQPFIDHIESNGNAFFDNIGFSVGDYTSDSCLEKFGWSREKAFKKKMIMACLMGLDVTRAWEKQFVDKYYEAAQDGVSYHGSWHNHNGEVSSDMRVKGHRHDQSVASIIIDDLGMPIINAQDTFFAYESHKGVVPVSDTVCLWSRGQI